MDVSSLTAAPILKNKKESGLYRYYSQGTLIAKDCSKCLESKSIYEFRKSSGDFDGFDYACRFCQRAGEKINYKPKPYKARDRSKAAKYDRARRNRLKSRSKHEIEIDRNRVHPLGVKSCKPCNKVLDLADFEPRKLNIDGLDYKCRECRIKSRIFSRRRKKIKYWKNKGIPIQCYVCGGDYDDADHVIALNNYGPDDMSNMLPMCWRCNRGPGGKFDISLETWLSSKYNDDKVKEILNRVSSYGVSIALQPQTKVLRAAASPEDNRM